MKIKVFGWLLMSNRLNTKNMLTRRHYHIDDGPDCLLCPNQMEETLEHMIDQEEEKYLFFCWRWLVCSFIACKTKGY